MSIVESIAIIAGDDNTDEVWISVLRTINGAVTRTIERFRTRLFDNTTLSDAWFVDAGGSGARTYTPAVAGSTTYGDYTEYFVGMSPHTGDKVVAKGVDDGTINTDWGTNGYWDAAPDDAPAYDMHQLDDGRMLVAHNYNKVTMIDTDGTTDTTWGVNGQYNANSDAGNITIYDILEDNSGNFYLFGFRGFDSTYVSVIKINSSGTFVDKMLVSETKCAGFYNACWSDSNKTRIIGSGIGYLTLGGAYPNLVAINPSTMNIDTTWTGNINGNPGFFDLGEAPTTETLYNIYTTSDGGFVVMRNDADKLVKVLSDGSAIDTSWGTNGFVNFADYVTFGLTEATNPAQDGDTFYLLVVESRAGDTYDVCYSIDSDGVATELIAWDVNSANTIHSVQVFNDKLIFGTTSSNPATWNVEIWTTAGVFESGFDVTNANRVWWVIPDVSTRETTVVPAVDESYGDVPTGYAHLEGETVNILADGIKYPPQTVTNGDIDDTEFSDASSVIVGLPVRYKLVPMELNFGDLGFCLNKRIVTILLDLFQSLDGKYGCDLTQTTGLDQIVYYRPNYDAGPTLFTGVKRLPVSHGYNREGNIILWGDHNLPHTVLGIGAKVGVE